ncbi:hypothetical protein PHYBLDRAFT_69347 [Phycomyces blakesleeanus NRRL 1555(-)]|uniref:Uncharacterized protein n=1 Tax=Phycomyces blakesleeanus (strain ATCC 8743b / DSM 1359 / FGSC 10004 / NBRC 33097 / NRRL 1555) TaxID=763407 RepID=A0A162TC56_PHYB8|nr:hypothetical protein PHYBLDRAFT_69347 [Phycomyces blakesleeanus NRRL 1555(-)]OAD67472.1 hypothetical protein PHYBLDRAFT_69347 [Phycomyces blakesleeanus NRRL 1555(-)]|eukprot:XP_018285512.1 hypothetical protein PHYBLDRAFT_69347 [Phycomyces blakesleeanus NRRL 1555(-)]
MSETPTTSWIDKQGNSPLPIWALSGLTFAAVPMAVKKAPGVPSLLQSMAFGAIFAAWCLSWTFLNAKRAVLSGKPFPLLMVAAVAADTAIYGKKYLQVNGYLA